MKLIKLNTDHYIIVDGSEIKEGDYIINIQRMHIYPTPVCADDVEYRNRRNDVFKKITHSTRPESLGMGWMQSVLPLLLSEVKELLNMVDVEKKAEKFIGCKYDDIEDSIDQIGYDSFIRGYNQALEDNKEKKYTEEDMKECVMSILRDLNTHNEIDKPVNFVWTDSFKKHIQSLQLKTEWEVEFVDGKLKLK